jgi:beta-mannosidase
MIRGVTGTVLTRLSDWELLPSAPGGYDSPAALPTHGWLPAVVPGTVAGSARAWAFPPAAAADPDAYDWWFRCRFKANVPEGGHALLRLAGLATVADVWFDGVHRLRSENMFLGHTFELTPLPVLGGSHDLVIRFSALAPLLAVRRPRPRWRTRLVADQNLRWYRTTLLGRIPAWSPGPAPVGPWRSVTLAVASRVAVLDASAVSSWEGAGVFDVTLSVRPLGGRSVVGARLVVSRGDGGTEESVLTVSAPTGTGGTQSITGRARLSTVDPWFPHTHGLPRLYPVTVRIWLEDGSGAAVDLGCTGFRTVTFAGDPSDFGLRVNGVEVFFRGGCWTPLDPLTLLSEPRAYRSALRQLRDAGANLVRICGPTYVESDAFYEACDELGVAVWHDFMFANMDYPIADTGFAATAKAEAGELLTRLGPRPCLAILCGNSEVDQQASMLGLPPEYWSKGWFHLELPDLCQRRLPAVPYWPSSPSGGALPMHPGTGDAHYQGVGAYLRDFDDAQTSGVRFASETLSFANVPEPSTLALLCGGESPSVQSPHWKAHSPRDRDAGWDFDDVRDVYLHRLFGVDPLAARYSDRERYLELSRVVSGEVMARVFAAWRGGERCRGGLVWFWRDLVPGAGWGVVDSTGTPKAAYHYLRRVWRPLAVLLLDRGLNGLQATVLNDSPRARDVVLRVAVYPRGVAAATWVERPLRVDAHGRVTLSVEDQLGGFRDLNHAYRFGPVGYDLVLAELAEPGPEGTSFAEDMFFPGGPPAERAYDIGLAAAVEEAPSGTVLRVTSRRPAFAVRVDVPGYTPDDNYFPLAPGRPKRVAIQPSGGPAGAHGTIRALNCEVPAVVTVPASAGRSRQRGSDE